MSLLRPIPTDHPLYEGGSLVSGFNKSNDKKDVSKSNPNQENNKESNGKTKDESK
jgi:hypothetical protein